MLDPCVRAEARLLADRHHEARVDPASFEQPAEYQRGDEAAPICGEECQGSRDSSTQPDGGPLSLGRRPVSVQAQPAAAGCGDHLGELTAAQAKQCRYVGRQDLQDQQEVGSPGTSLRRRRQLVTPTVSS
jgi:hypothetical protein